MKESLMNVIHRSDLLSGRRARRSTLAGAARMIACWLVVVASPLVLHGADKKFIELGWDIPDTAFLREQHRVMEQEGPFDGVIFRVEAKNAEGRTISTQGPWSREPWQREWFQGALHDLQACQFTQYTDNFLLFNATPARIAWTDDEGWNALEEKLRICAWLAREGHVKGIAPDFEPYGENQWKFDPAQGPSFAETVALARQRGAQFTRGIAAEMPHGVILTLFLNSVVARAGHVADPATVLAQEHYGLLPAFFNGMLDAAPPEIVLVDGCENGYYLDSVEAYQRAALDMRSWNGPAIRLVAPESRAKYRAQVQAGFGFYLDMFVNEPGHVHYRGPWEGSRLKHLSRNLTAARDASDQYVWIYGEQCRWWSGLAKEGPWREQQLMQTAGKGRSWDEALPGITRAIAWARAPEAAARSELAALQAHGAAVNLAANADFQAGPPDGSPLPRDWHAWQDEKNASGTFAWDDSVGAGSARATKVAWGCFLQSIPVTPGSLFVVRATCRTHGQGATGIVVRWQTSDGHWTHEADDRTLAFASGPDQWQTAFGVVTVPPDVGQLLLLLDIHGQQTDSDVCWFDNVEVYRLSDGLMSNDE
jgi:hypothetical protein